MLFFFSCADARAKRPGLLQLWRWTVRRRRQARAGRGSAVSARPRRLFFLIPLILDLPKGAWTGIWRGLLLRSWRASSEGRRVGEGRPWRSRIPRPRPAQAFRRPLSLPRFLPRAEKILGLWRSLARPVRAVGVSAAGGRGKGPTARVQRFPAQRAPQAEALPRL